MIRLAKKIATKSKFPRARVGAVIMRGGVVISTGVNKIGSSKETRDSKQNKATIHAEEAAIISLLKKKKQAFLVGSTLFVTRVLKNGSPSMAKPCKDCQRLIFAVGIKKVFYTTETDIEQL